MQIYFNNLFKIHKTKFCWSALIFVPLKCVCVLPEYYINSVNYMILHSVHHQAGFVSVWTTKEWFGQVKPCTCSQTCSSGHSNTSSSVCSSSSSSSSLKSSISAKPSASDQPLPSVLSSPFRSSLRYDVFVCHNDEDSDLAQSLASFLEAPSNGLRCYLQERDCAAGGAVSSELLQAGRTVTAGCTRHSKLCEGWVVLVSDAPGPVWRAHVTEDHPSCSKHAQIPAPARTALPLHCGSEHEQRLRIHSSLQGGASVWVFCIYTSIGDT